MIMRKILLVFLYWISLPCLSLHAQNNPIFSGGESQGYHQAYFSQISHNKIFEGGNHDGFASARFSQAVNNRIFFGGNGQGYVHGYVSQPINGNIFAGGVEDGAAQMSYAMLSNNSIFAGGMYAGYDQSYYSQKANNPIFGGGIGEGYDHVLIEGLPASLNPVFPIELLSFDAWPERGQVHIEWVTASEINHDYFRIERSQDTRISEVIGLVWGQGGLQQVQAYELKDPEPLLGYSYYRLQSFDKDGAMELSSWVEVFFEGGSEMSLSVFPNPTHDLMTVRIKGELSSGVEVEVFDLMGRPLGLKQDLSSNSGEIETQLSMGEMPVGIYLLRIRNLRNGESMAYRVKVFR